MSSDVRVGVSPLALRSGGGTAIHEPFKPVWPCVMRVGVSLGALFTIKILFIKKLLLSLYRWNDLVIYVIRRPCPPRALIMGEIHLGTEYYIKRIKLIPNMTSSEKSQEVFLLEEQADRRLQLSWKESSCERPWGSDSLFLRLEHVV